MYNFGLHIDGVPHTVNPIWADSTVKNSDKENGHMFYREKLNGTFTFVRSQFDLINDAPFAAYFHLVLAKTEPPGTTYWQGYFHKTDCDFDEDQRIISVQPNTLDTYDDVLNGYEKKFNLIDLSPERETVKYKKQPLIQVYLPGSAFVTNFLSGTWWEQPVIEPAASPALLPPFHFGFDSVLNTTKNFIAGDDLVPDVSGSYTQDGSGNTERNDNAYGFIYQNIGNGGDQWTIVDRNNSNTVVYVGAVGESTLFGYPGHSEQGVLLTSLTSASQCRIMYAQTYARYLTNELTVNGTPTNPIPVPDFVQDSNGYSRVLELEVNELIGFGGHSVTPDRFGKFADNAANNAGDYFTKATAPLNEKVYPLVRSEWTEVSWWFYYTSALKALQEDGSKTITLNHAYPLASVIKVLLGEIAVGVSYEETDLYSQFLHAAMNPVSNEANKRIFITPKSNVKTGDYDHPATKAEVRFSDVMNMLKNVYQCYWHIDSKNKFRIEHISWYENGGSYLSPNIGSDLTTLVEPKTKKRWSYKSKKYNFDKLEMPEQVTFSWMDNVSLPFDGFDINIISNYVQKGNIEERPAGIFTSDIDFIQVQPGSITDEGFVLIAAEDVSGEWIVPFVDLIADGEDYKVQNGHLSNIYLHTRYHKHNLPATDVEVNKEATTATTVKRYKNQNITFPSDSDPNGMALIKTDLGDGTIDKAEINLITGAVKATVKHD